MTFHPALRSWGGYDRDNPFPLFKEIRDHGPVHRVTLVDGHDAWLVVAHREARAALNDPRLSKDMHAALARTGDVVAEGLPGPDFARHMLAVDPPDHTRLRRLVAGAFSARRVEAMRTGVERIVARLLDAIEQRGPDAVVDLVEAYAFPLPFTVICELLGIPEEGRAPFGRALGAMLVPTSTPDEYARAKAASDEVVAFLHGLVAEKRCRPDGALVSALLAEGEGEGEGDGGGDGDPPLSEQELLSTIFQLIIAGHDTTSSLIGNGVVALLDHPRQLAHLRANPALIAGAVEELIRYDAPVPHSTFRYAVAPIELGGVTIPAGAQVIVNLASANRDRGRANAPEELDITRAGVNHLGFGHGIHFCLGAQLARMEGQIALGQLIQRFPRMRLAVPVEDLHWDHGDGLVLRGLSALPVVPGPPACPSPSPPIDQPTAPTCGRPS